MSGPKNGCEANCDVSPLLTDLVTLRPMESVLGVSGRLLEFSKEVPVTHCFDSFKL